MRIRAVVFDAYGTLFDTADGSVQATTKILLKNGPHLDPAEVYARWKEHHKRIISNLSRFLTEQSIFVMGLDLTYQDFGITGYAPEDVKIMLATLDARQLFPDVLPCLESLKGRFEIVIASNTDSRPFLENLRQSPLSIDKWVTSESLQAYKPQRTFYERMLSYLHRDPCEVVFVGDSLDADVLVPIALGMHGVWLNRKQEKNPYNEQRISEISTLTELNGLIATLEKE